ncbi:MAG: phage major capsid protein [Chloroflexota bacterium]
MQTRHTAKMLFEDDDTAIIGLYGVVFGGEDLEGESFSKSTDFKLNRAVGAPVHIDHTAESYIKFNDQTYVLKGIKDEIGEIVEVSPDEIGLYMQLQFEKSNEYWGLVEAMLNTGRMGASTGSDHRAQKSANGLIEIWPINEVSLTLTPAEPRTTENVTRFKSEGAPIHLNAEWQKELEGVAKSAEKLAEDLASFQNGSIEEFWESMQLHTQNTGIKSNQLTDSEQSAEASPEAHGAGEQSDTSETDDTEDGQLEAIEDTEPVDAPEVSEMTTETVVFDQEAAFKALLAGQAEMKSVIDSQAERIDALENTPSSPMPAADPAIENAKSVAYNKTQRGDTEAGAFKAWFKTGDGGTINAAQGQRLRGNSVNIKASNDTIGNLTTAVDGGNAVPVGHFNQIIARRDESMLSRTLGIRSIPGKGLTVNVPLDTEDDGEFVATAEQNDGYTNNFDRDMPAIGQKALTLAKYSKKIALTDELLMDEDSRLLAFIEDYIGRGMSKTHNSLLASEVIANGTTLATLAATNAIADGEIEDVEADDDLAPYLDNSNSVAWVMRNSTLGAIRKISGNDRVYSVESGGGPGVRNGRSLIGYPVYHSQKVAALSAGAGSNVALFGNFNFVGYREAPSMQLIRDEISVDGVVLLKYYFRTVYGVLQPEAVGKVVTAAS